MAEVATPSTNGGTSEKKVLVKPERPDEETHKKAVNKASKELDDAKAKFDAIRAKIESAQPNNKDTPSAKKRAELLAELKIIREKQAKGKGGRTQIFEQIKKEDDKLKSLIAEQKVSRSRTPFKSVDDVDREIDRLDKQVGGGMMKLVDEKKALAEISSLRKQRKAFAGLDDQQKKIDDVKKSLAEKRKELDDPESRKLSDSYNKLQAELDVLKAEQDDVHKNLNSLRDERNKLHAAQQEKYQALKVLKDNYYQANRAVQQYEWEARKKAKERRAAEQEAYDREKKKERAQKMLAEASDKAYLDEIRRAESLIRFLDPSFKKENAPLQAPSGLQAQASRTVDSSGLKGTKVVKKEEEDYFAGTGGKKGKKGRKTAAADSGAATPPAAGKYSCPPSVLEDCAFIKIDPPMSAADIPKALEEAKKKLADWRANQDAETQKNIDKAKKEVERLEAEESSHSTGESHAPNGHGETKATASVDEGGSIKNELNLEEAAEKDVVADLKEASLEDKE